MREGWLGDDYLMLFDGSEAVLEAERYGLDEGLPGYSLVGLHNWDDFIVRAVDGALHLVPSVPIRESYLRPFEFSGDVKNLKPDDRFTGRIRWFLQPMLLGGDPSSKENTIWIDPSRHAELVRWWNGRLNADQTALRT